MSSQNKLLTVLSLSGNFSCVLTSILFSLFIVFLVQLCLLKLFRAFFSWEECGINWQWWLHWKHNSWPLCHYCFCNCSSAVTACQLFWWHSFAPAPVSILDEVNPVYLLEILNMILVNCKYYCSLYSIAIIEIQNLVIL